MSRLLYDLVSRTDLTKHQVAFKVLKITRKYSKKKKEKVQMYIIICAT